MATGEPESRSAMQRLREIWAGEAKAKSEIIFSRAWGLFTAPDAEWDQIRQEDTTVPNLMFGYVLPVAAVPTFGAMIGSLIFGNRLPDGSVSRPDVFAALANGVVTCLSVIALVYLVGLLINLIAEQFDGDRHEMNALKVAAYTPTPVLVTGLFSIYPPLWWVSILGVAWSAFLLYKGLPALMRCPQERAPAYATTVMIVSLIALLTILVLSGCVMGVGRT
jgi:hypothetical protein